MADTTALKNRIRAAVKANDNQEITGPVLQQTLLDIVDELSDKIINEYAFVGIAIPTTIPPSNLTEYSRIFYLAAQNGVYTNLGGIEVSNEIAVIKYDGSAWSKDTVINIDDTPTAESSNLVKSGGIASYDRRTKILLNEIGFLELFTVDKGYITKSGTISKANSSNYKRTGYIKIQQIKGCIVTLCSNSYGNCIAFVNDSDNVVGYINETTNGYHTYNINDELLENYPTATRIILATTDEGSGIKLNNSYDEIQKKINTNTQGILTNVNGIAANSQSIEAINSKVGQIDIKVNSNEERVVFNDPDSVGTWNDTSLSGVPYLQKVDSEYYGKYAYGFKFLQRDYDAEVLQFSLVTCDDETVSSSSKFIQYKYSYYTLTEDNANKVTTVMFNEPVLIKPNSYIRILGAPTSAGGAGGNGKPVTIRYNHNGTKIIQMPFSAVQFAVYDNQQLGLGVIVGEDSIPTRLDKMQDGIAANSQSIAANSQSIEAINSKVGQIDIKVNSNEERVVFNDPDSIGTWNNTSICGVPFVQKIDAEYEGIYAYGLKFLQHNYTAEVLRFSLATCNDETLSASSVFSIYKSYDYTLTQANANKVITMMFDEPVLIRANSYIRIKGAPTSAGGTGGNGQSVTARYNHSGTKVFGLPFGNVQFTVYNNMQLALGVIIGADSLSTRLDKMQDEIDDVHIGEMKRDIFYGSEIFTIPNGIDYTGKEVVNSNIYHSDYIPLNNAEYISFPCAWSQSEPVGAAFYDKDKVFIGGVLQGNTDNHHYYSKYPIKENYPKAAYAIFNNIFFSQYNNVKLFKSSDESISDAYLSTYRRGAALWIPSKLYCVVGRTLQIFKRSILYANNIDNFRISISVVSGTDRFISYKEYFEYSPLSGDANVVCDVRCTNLIGEVFATRRVTFVPVPIPTSPQNIKNILFIGDSWTQAIYPAEVSRMLTGSPTTHQSSVSNCQFPTALNLTNINFIGTNKKGAYPDMPYREGAAGKTLTWHLSNESPFYREGAIDFTKYMNSGDVRGTIADPQTGDKIDICVIIHGRNAGPRMGEIKTIIDKLKEHNPNIIILFGFNMISAINNNSALYGQSETYTPEDMFERLIATSYTNVYLLPIQCGLDTRYNMIYQEKYVNYRNTKFNEVVNHPSNIYHPNDNGYCELADVVFYELSAFI